LSVFASAGVVVADVEVLKKDDKLESKNAKRESQVVR
jgi:hypothetical protein